MAQVAQLVAEVPVPLTVAETKDIREMVLGMVARGIHRLAIDEARAEALRQVRLLKSETAKPQKGKAL